MNHDALAQVSQKFFTAIDTLVAEKKNYRCNIENNFQVNTLHPVVYNSFPLLLIEVHNALNKCQSVEMRAPTPFEMGAALTFLRFDIY